nr:E2/UBC family protein [Amphibacillus sp. MSJ-3]
MISKKLNYLLDNVYENSEGQLFGDYSSSNGKTIKLKIVFPTHFPNELPKVYIQNLDEIDLFIPHLDSNGLICYVTSNNVIYDSRNEDNVLFSSVQMAIKTIETGIKKLNYDDFRNEFIAFWDQQKDLIPVDFFAEPNDEVKRLEVFLYKEENLILTDIDNQDIPSKFYTGKIDKANSADALYIPLRLNNKILPPNPRKGWGKKELLKLIRNNTTQSKKNFFDRWIKAKSTSIKILILKIPIDKKNEVIIGYWFDKNKQSIKKQLKRPTPLLVTRSDLKYLLERTSGEHYFTNLNVCIVGLGSVGGKLSSELSDLGITKMTLIDYEAFEKDNLFRHELGANSLKVDKFNYKVDNLQNELEKKNPYLEVDVESMNVLGVIKSDPTFFDKFDYTFICVGDTMTSLALNSFFKKGMYKVFYSWVEPLGIGGHILYTDYSQKGCFQCLNTSVDEGIITSNRSSLAAPNQHIEKNLASCRSSFVPYGSLTSSEAAIRTTEIFYKVITEQIKENTLYSWLGDTYHFKSLGYLFSNRYRKFEHSFPIYEKNFKNEKCKICGDHS